MSDKAMLRQLTQPARFDTLRQRKHNGRGLFGQTSVGPFSPLVNRRRRRLAPSGRFANQFDLTTALCMENSMRFADRISRGATAAFTLAFVMIMTMTMARPAQAQNENVIYTFCSLTNCDDGAAPVSNVIMDAQGNMYGTASGYGAKGGGTVFKLEPSGTVTVLYTFCSVVVRRYCSDGSNPDSGLVRDSASNLYGTTYGGGAHGLGTVFKLSSGGTLTTLHSFNNNGADGYAPYAGLLMDSAGNLYGTTPKGGKYGAGTVYRVTPTGTENIMHSFGATPTDGTVPEVVVPVMDRLGNLYGTTLNGGTHGDGTVFEITAGGEEFVLYNFGATKTDGIIPGAGLTIDAKGNLYGATTSGGTHNEGTVFRVTHSGTETTIHSFQNNGTDGYFCQAPLVRDDAGNLYGVTVSGGQYHFGTVFEVNASGVETILHAFAGGTDGIYSQGELLMDSAGNLYGTTSLGGTHSEGTVFEVTP
jgi:uncharacterized repeat protein (TIGR03803 family)